jgi:putative alpha-1,2-mannosidase
LRLNFVRDLSAARQLETFKSIRPYVQSATLNRKPLSRAWIRHSEIAAGGVLEFIMGPELNKKWATQSHDLPPSMSTSA